ncbi:hypothetical protein EJD97_005999 [Solanum chilense]|uniref:Uncharacterized protein n=1 Tax=Solanum chilense TaxID=4083 RepID=A0A6N2AIR5_SOLCI|nr:hypothetical protein EJD97_005999 [Solanum chilense]
MDPVTSRRMYDYDGEDWKENRKKYLHDYLNFRKEPNKDIPKSSRSKVAKNTPKKEKSISDHYCQTDIA